MQNYVLLSIIYLSVCLYVNVCIPSMCTWIYTSVSGWMYTTVFMWKTEVSILYFLNHFPHHFLRQGLSLNPNSSVLTHWLANELQKWSLSLAASCSTQLCVMYEHHPARLFIWVLYLKLGPSFMGRKHCDYWFISPAAIFKFFF